MTADGVVTRARAGACCGWRASDGTVGYGEAAPFEPYDGVPLERAIAALSGGGGRPAAAGARGGGDRAARPGGAPGAAPAGRARRATRSPVNMTLPAGPPEEVAARAREGAARRLRLLQGQGRAARGRRAGGRGARGGRARGRRCAWTPTGPGRSRRRSTRIRALRATTTCEFVEQPCRTPRGAAPGARARVHADRRRRVGRHRRAPCGAPSSMEACDVVNVKLAGAGGFKAAREALRLARANGLGAFLSSTLDGPWGIAAALQLAAAGGPAAGLRAGDARPVRRAGRAGAAGARNGTLKVPGGPGLGVELDEGALADVVVDETPRSSRPADRGSLRRGRSRCGRSRRSRRLGSPSHELLELPRLDALVRGTDDVSRPNRAR